MAFDPLKEGAVAVFDPESEGAVAIEPKRIELPDSEIIDKETVKAIEDADLAEIPPLRILDTLDVNRMTPKPIADPDDVSDLLGAIAQGEKETVGFVEAFKTADLPAKVPLVGYLYRANKFALFVEAKNFLEDNKNPFLDYTNVIDLFSAEQRAANLIPDPVSLPQERADTEYNWSKSIVVVENWMQELNRAQNLTTGGKIAEGILELPSFIAEFMLTTPLFRSVNATTQVAVKGILRRSGFKIANKYIARTAGALTGTAARTFAMTPRVATGAFERLLPTNFELTEKGEAIFTESVETPFTAVVKSFGDVYIENLSEISGGAINKLGSKIPFLNKFHNKLRKSWLNLNPGKNADDFASTILKAGGFNGFLAEMGEERVGDLLRAITGVDNFGLEDAGIFERIIASIPDGEDLLVEAGVLAPLTLLGIGGRVARGRAGATPEAGTVPLAAKVVPEGIVVPPEAAEGKEIRKSVERIEKEARDGIITPQQAMNELLAKQKEIEADPKNRLPKGDFRIFTKAAEKKLDEIGHAISRKLPLIKQPSPAEAVEAVVGEEGEPFIKEILAGEEFPDIGQFSVETKKELAKLVKAGEVLKIPKQGEFPVPKTVYVGLAGREASDVISLVKQNRLDAIEESLGFPVEAPKIDRTKPESQQQVSEAVNQVRQLPAEEQTKTETKAIEDVKGRISFKKPKVKIRQRFKNLLFKTDKAFRDEFAGLRRIVEAADVGELEPADDPVQLAVAFTQKSSAKTRGFVLEATTDLAGNRKSKGLKQIFTPIIKDGGKKKFEDFVTYLVAARDLNLQKQNKETGIDPIASQLTFDALDSSEFAQAAREVTEWNQKGIDLLVESGRITRESGDAIKLANPIYAPFFREFEDEPGITTRKGKKFVPKKLKGSKRKIIDPIEGMIQQMDATISSAQKAAIERSLANLATQNPEALETFIKPTRAPIVPTKLTVKEIKSELEEIGIDFTGVANEDLNELLTVFRPSAFPATQGIIKLKVEGKNKFFKVEKELLEVLDGVDVYKLGPFWDFVIGKPTRLLKLGATGLNPAFGLIRNPIRDIQTFTVTSEFARAGPFSALSGILKDTKTKSAGIAENFGFESLKKDSDVVKFAALGGEMSGFITQDRAGTRHIQHEMLASNGVRYTINTFRHPLDVLRSLIGVTEIGTRIGEFSAALKEGERLYGKGSLSASVFALNAAQDVTTNFTRHGQIGKQLNQIIPFVNAAIQGPDKIVRSFKARPLKSTIAAVSALTIPAIFFWWRNKDKPWYRNMTAHEKASYIHFEHPDNEDVIIRFPTAFELGHIFQAVPVAFLDAVYNSRPQEITEILKSTLRTANPLDWPSLIGPIIDIKANEDFAGRPIVSRSNEGKLPEDQFGPRTTDLMKVIGKTINMSPSQIEHLVNSYSGGIYNRVARILRTNDMEKQPADILVVGTLFLRDPFAPRKQVEDFYKERKELNQKFQSKKITLRQALRRVAINNIATVINFSFDTLRDTKTIDERKRIWSDIEKAIRLVDNLSPK